MTGTLSLLLDTNVWLDYFLARPNQNCPAENLLVSAVQDDSVSLFYASSSAKDVFFIIERSLKDDARNSGREIDSSIVQAANATAWACIENMSELACAIPADESDMWMARKLRHEHSDFEDNLILAAANRIKADYVVTSDKQLLAHMPAVAISPNDMIKVLREIS